MSESFFVLYLQPNLLHTFDRGLSMVGEIIGSLKKIAQQQNISPSSTTSDGLTVSPRL